MGTKWENTENEEAPSLFFSSLFMSDDEYEEKQLIYNLLENDSVVLNSPILNGMRLVASSYGWLVLVSTMRSYCCLWNPTSMEIINLPNLECWYSICVLSKPPTEPDCLILFSGSHDEQAFCRIGDGEFCRVEEINQDGHAKGRLMAVGNFKGTIYGIIQPDDTIVTIHYVGKTVEFRPIMRVDGDDEGEPWRVPQLSRQVSTPYVDMWFIESPAAQSACSGKVELLLVKKTFSCRYIDDSFDFKVFLIDPDRMTCVELDDIGQRAIFVSHHGGGFCCRSSSKIKPNSIYYTDQYGKYLYIYELQDSSTTSLLPSDLADPYSVTTWVEPQIFSQIIQ